MKPICCGDRQDAELLLSAGSGGVTIDDVNPAWLKTPAAPMVGSLMEEVDIDVDHILTVFRSLEDRFEHVIVEGTGGWMVPIHRGYFLSDLAVAMKLPVIAVAYNRLGCLNHAVLTVQSILGHGLYCAGFILNDARKSADIASLTNADILGQIVGVPVLGELGENLTQLPDDWRFMLRSVACRVDTGL
jgi:dethiobiotin synthetase